MGRLRRVLGAAAATAVLAGCSIPGVGADGPEGVEVADGWTVEVVRADLERPTQLSLLGDGLTVVVAELAGGESEGSGRVVDIGDEGVADDPIVLLDDLLTPTGAAIVSPTALYVQEQATFSSVTLEGETPFAPGRPPTGATVEVVAEGLPDNGRSQGTVTVLPDGRALFVSTGSGSGPDVGESGRLYGFVPGSSVQDTPVTGAGVVAVGFKNAYAHAVGPDGSLYVTEVGDGSYDGEAPPDELHVITPDVVERTRRGGEPFDGGWPRCTGVADPTEEFGVTAEDCEALTPPLATFPPRSTPTSVAVTGDGRVLVTLWVEGRVVEVDPDSGEVTDVLTGAGNPQHLLALPDGDLLLTVHDRGELWRLTPPDGRD